MHRRGPEPLELFLSKLLILFGGTAGPFYTEVRKSPEIRTVTYVI